MIVLIPKNVQIDKDVIRQEFMLEYDSKMDTSDSAYSTFGSKKGEWVSLKKNIFAAVHFCVDYDAHNDFTTIFIHDGGTKVGNYLGADLWGPLFYGSFIKNVETKFIYWLLKKYDLKKAEIKLKREPFFKSIVYLIVLLVIEYVLSLDFEDYGLYAIIALITIAIFIPYWYCDRRYISKKAEEIGIEVV